MFKNIAVLLTAASVALAQSFSINTPASLVQCQPASVTWVGGTSPFILAVIPGGQVSAAAIETLSTSLTSSPYTWSVNLASGTYITLKITDSTGAIAYSSPLTIQAGASDSCLNTTAVTSGLTTGAVTTTGSGSAVLSATTSASGATTSTTSVMSSAAASSAASSAATSSAAAASTTTRASSTAPASTSAPASSAPAATTSSTGGALPSALVNAGGIAAAAIGGLAMLF